MSLNSMTVLYVQETYDDFSNYIKMVETTIDMNLSDNHEYVIKPSFDEGLMGKYFIHSIDFCMQ